MLSLPIYLRGATYYLHTRFCGVQIKRSLKTPDQKMAIIRASKFIESMMMALDITRVRKYELDLSRGFAKAEGEEDHARLMELLAALVEHQPQNQPHESEGLRRAGPIASTKAGLTLLEALEKFFLLKKLKPATVLAHTNTVTEFTNFLKRPSFLSDISVDDITSYQEFLAKKGNVPRTIDGKVGYLKSIFNFSIKQGYLKNAKNPAENMTLQTKKQKLTEGYSIFEIEEIKRIYTSEYFKNQKLADPDYYFVLLIALVSGCRIGEITSLTKSQFKLSENNNRILIIREAKTFAGKREIPLPEKLFDDDFLKFFDSKTDALFKYSAQEREGKGTGNAVGKKFARHLKELKIEREKLVFHSIRKFCNDYFLKNGIEFEPRCQFFGHEIEAVNVATYSKKFNSDQLFTLINPVQNKLLDMAKI